MQAYLLELRHSAGKFKVNNPLTTDSLSLPFAPHKYFFKKYIDFFN